MTRPGMKEKDDRGETMKKEEFIEEVRASEEMLYHTALSVLRNEADTADAVQEALLKAYENLPSLREDRYFRSWLVRILLNECYRIQRHQKKIVAYEEYMDQEEAEQAASYSELYQAILLLSREQRVAVTLFYIDGFSIEEISMIIGTGKSTVKTRLYRARARLRELLGDKEEVTC